MPWRSLSERDRLDRANGQHNNQVIRAFFTGAGGSSGAGGVKQAFFMMDRWLAAIESDSSATPLEQKVINNKPADVHDARWAGRRLHAQAVHGLLLPLDCRGG